MSEAELVAIPTSIPDRIGPADVARLRDATRSFRLLDARYGGGACYDAVLAFLSWGRRILEAETTELITKRLYVALAELYGLAGWAAFDLNQIDSAHSHLDRACTLAHLGGDEALVADVGYRRGRIYLHHDAPEKAQQEFRLGQYAAQSAGSRMAEAILLANQAWAYAAMGRADESIAFLGHSVDEFLCSDGADGAEVPAWARFFDTTHLLAVSGVIYTELAQILDPAYTRFAIPALARALARSDRSRARSRSLTLMTLATSHLIAGRADRAVRAGTAAIATARDIVSTRTTDRLLRLRTEADRRSGDADARELSERITRFVLARSGGRPGEGVNLG